MTYLKIRHLAPKKDRKMILRRLVNANPKGPRATEPNDTQHNDTQPNDKKRGTQHNGTP
jgi:hypothetical protein